MILEISGVSKFYKNELVLDELDFFIDSPEIIALVAPNGSGKSTLMNIICNLEKADAGEIKIFGQPATKYTNFYQLSYLQDNSVLYDSLSGLDHLQLIMDMHKLSSKRIEEVTEELGMQGYLKKKVKNYSLGMKQHLLFAMSILPKPKLLLLDEPLNGLDPSSVAKVRTILKRMNQEDATTVLFSSHNLEEIDKLTSNCIFLSEGKIISVQDIETTQGSRYKIFTDNLQLLIKKAEMLSLEYQQLTEYQLEITMTEVEFQKIRAFCCDEKKIIFDDELIATQSESLYFDLFEEG
ncbi:ABC transporter ATP-binding protein [Carnobacterium gallinarum]|uniref:ABC transporter ATP-binding protein n=1 Tax=Carnobacterium gallinarum TaxID=2749 RepID=UPI00055496EC|nr:ABC transporter ATP-binding protein [Carnobacterium gallinarum]